MNLMDTLWLLAELEHSRRHLLRTARITKDEDKQFKCMVKSKEAQDLRRRVQEKLELEEEDWCQVKAAMAIKQLAYETFAGDIELLGDLEDYTDSLLTLCLDEDFSGCPSCRADAEEMEGTDGN